LHDGYEMLLPVNIYINSSVKQLQKIVAKCQQQAPHIKFSTHEYDEEPGYKKAREPEDMAMVGKNKKPAFKSLKEELVAKLKPVMGGSSSEGEFEFKVWSDGTAILEVDFDEMDVELQTPIDVYFDGKKIITFENKRNKHLDVSRYIEDFRDYSFMDTGKEIMLKDLAGYSWKGTLLAY